VGKTLDPALDVARVSRRHVARVYRRQFDPKVVLRDALRGAPELVDMAVRLPQLLAAGFTRAEEVLATRAPGNPLAGLRSAILAAACIVGGVIAVIQGGAPALWITLFALALVLSLFGR